jgi:hypothetical protein
MIGLRVLPGADVRIEDGMVEKLSDGDVLTLADRGRHVLLELPHELFFPMDDVLARLRRANLVGILSHPERNQGLAEAAANRRIAGQSRLSDAGDLRQFDGHLWSCFAADGRMDAAAGVRALLGDGCPRPPMRGDR